MVGLNLRDCQKVIFTSVPFSDLKRGELVVQRHYYVKRMPGQASGP